MKSAGQCAGGGASIGPALHSNACTGGDATRDGASLPTELARARQGELLPRLVGTWPMASRCITRCVKGMAHLSASMQAPTWVYWL